MIKRDKGFALVITMGLGLIMTLLGLSILIKSKNDKDVSYSQEQKARGFNTAEDGITSITAFLNKNRSLVIYDKSQWQTYLERPTDTSVANLKKSFEGCKSSSDVSNLRTQLGQLVNGNWLPVGDGFYRLVDYDFDSGSSIATLSVEGKSSAEVPGGEKLQVKMKITNTKLTGNLPGLWLDTDSDGTGNNNLFETNQSWFNNCAISRTQMESERTRLKDPNPSDPIVPKAEYTSIPLPPLPTPNLASIPTDQRIEITDNLTLPRPTDDFEDVTIDVDEDVTTDGDEVSTTIRTYRYLVSNINLPANKTLTVNTVEDDYTVGTDASGNSVRNYITPRTPRRIQVIFYLTGSISKGGDIQHPCTSTLCKPTDFQIYGYGGNGQVDFITIPDVLNPSICTNGRRKFEAFVLAPGYTFGVEGGPGAGGFNGSVWGANWSNGGGCGSNSNQEVLISAGTWEDLAPAIQVDNPSPTLGNVTTFEQGSSE